MAKGDSRQSAKEKQHGKENAGKSRMNPWMYVFSVAILIIIVVTFVGGPLVSGAGGGGSISFGSYDGEEITYVPGNYLSRQRDAIAEQVNDSGNNTNLEWIAYQVWRSAFQRSVVHTAILKESEESGVRIPEERIDQALTNYGGYQENGSFSAERYRETPNAEKASIRKFYREELTHSQYLNDTLYGVKTPSAAEDFIRQMASPERSFEYLSIGYGAFPEDMVWSYADSNAELFRSINLSRITVNSSQEAAQGLQQQLSGDDTLFEELARTQSVDAYSEAGGYIGWQYFYSLSSELDSADQAETIFALGAGDVSPVIETPFGWVIYKANEATRPVAQDNDEDIATVRQYMTRFERGTIEDYLISEAEALREELGVGGFAAAEAAPWNYGETASFPLNYGNIEILKPVQDASQTGALSNAAFNETILSALFGLEENEVSDALVLDDKVYLFRLNEIVEPDESVTETVGLYYTYLAQQYMQADLQAAILGSEKLENNFDAVFTKYFLAE